jgi:RNA polymerase sigma factor (sigma-70 family)
MASASVGDLGRHLGRLFGAGSAVGLSDGELLERFARRRDEAAEAAFETLLARHGAMVLTVCRQVLGDPHSAEDAFQATFLVLVRRAAALRVRDPGSLGPWLHGVAYRISLKARQAAARRRARERRAARPNVGRPSAAIEQVEVGAVLHEEVNRLPAKYRAPVVLCYLEGRTHDEAAAALRWPVGTVRGRLSRARDRLRSRLARRGLAPGGWIGASLPVPALRMEPPAPLIEATVTAAVRGMPAGGVTTMAHLLLRSLVMTRLELAATAVATVLMVAGLGLVLCGAPTSPRQPRLESVSAPAAASGPRSNPGEPAGDPLPEHARARLGGTRFHHGDGIGRVIYAPDGHSLVAIDDRGGVRVWEAASGRLLRVIGDPPAHGRGIALSPDGRTLATIEETGQLRIWDLASGRERRRWHAIQANSYQCLIFSPDGRTVAAGITIYDGGTQKEEKAINLWDIAAPTEHRRRFGGDWLELQGLVFSADGRTLVSGSNDTESRIIGEKAEKGSTRLWDVATGRERARFPVTGCHVRSIALSPDGRVLASGLTDETIRLRDLTTGRERVLRLSDDDAVRGKPRPDAVLVPAGVAPPAPMVGDRGPGVMTCLAFSPDGSILASGSSGTGNTGSTLLADVYLWDVARGEVLRHFPAHQGWTNSIGFSPDGRTLASTGPETVIRLWEVSTGREASPQPGHRSRIRTLVISPTDGTVFTGGQDGTVRHWDLASGRELDVIARLAGPADPMAIAPDGRTLLIGINGTGQFFLWSIAERREIRRFPSFGAFSPDGKTVAWGRQIWDTATGQPVVTPAERDQGKDRDEYLIATFYSPDGKATIRVDGEGVVVRDIATGKERRAIRSRIRTFHPTLSPDGRFLAMLGLDERRRGGKLDASIHLWELASGQEATTLEGHEVASRDLAFSPDGRFLASGSVGEATGKEESVRVWDLATGRESRRFLGHLGPINAVKFTPDGRSVVSGSEDGTALVWDVSELSAHAHTGRPITAEMLRVRWQEMAAADARAAYRATWDLSAPSAVAFLRERLRPASSPDPAGVPATDGPIAPREILRTLRAIAALERAGTPEAAAVLERMARGNPGAIETRDAQSALDRVSRRPEAQASSSIR